MTGADERVPEHVAAFRRLRALFGDAPASGDAKRRARTAKDATSSPYGTGRDPRGIADVLGALTTDLGWEAPIAKADVLASWPDLVGPNNAEHSVPAGIEDGVLVIRCDSTAWVTQLRLLRGELTAKIAERYPAAGIQSVRLLGPDVPNFKRGPRAVPGRGPRDTYG